MSAHVDLTLAGLAVPARRQIVDHLRRGPRRAGELASACGLSMPAMIRHLCALRRCGLGEGRGLEGDARVRLYHLRPEPFGDLRAWLAEAQEFWLGQLVAFTAHAERRSGAGERK